MDRNCISLIQLDATTKPLNCVLVTAALCKSLTNHLELRRCLKNMFQITTL